SAGMPYPTRFRSTVSGGGGGSQHIGTNDGVTFTNLAAGSHTVTLSGIASNCSVSSGTQRTVNVPAGGSTSASFSVTCSTPPPPTVRLNVSTDASDSTVRPEAYTVTRTGGGDASHHIGTTDSV